MTTFLRYTGIVLGVIILAVVLTACGEGACEACLHACCGASDRPDRGRGLVGRVMAACAACGVGIGPLVSRTMLRTTPPSGGWLSVSLFATGVSALRI